MAWWINVLIAAACLTAGITIGWWAHHFRLMLQIAKGLRG